MDAATTPKPLKTPPKISVKIWRPIIEKLDAKLDAACLRRDAYLAKLLATELDHLDAEVSLPNSPAAHDFTLERLDAFDRKLVSIALAPDLVRDARRAGACRGWLDHVRAAGPFWPRAAALKPAGRPLGGVPCARRRFPEPMPAPGRRLSRFPVVPRSAAAGPGLSPAR